MKYAILAGALAFVLCAGVCEAENGKMKSGSASAAANAAPCCPSGTRHIDLGDDNEKPVTSVGVMSEGQNYDGNTGFPNVVKSDANMNVE